MAVTNPPGWLQNAGSTHTAAQLRQYIAGSMAGNFSTATSLRTRGGIHPSLGEEFRTHQAGSPNMTVLVEPGVCCIPGTEAGSQGNYWACNDAQVTLSIAAAHATLPRIDIVVVNIRDTFYSGASNDSQLQVITGTPAASPVAPTAPVNSIIICQVAVAAAVTSIVDANITDTRFYLAAAGGVINSRTLAAAPVTAEIVEGQLVWAMDTNTMYIWDGSAYTQTYPPAVTKLAEQILVGNASVITFNNIPSTYRELEIHWTSRDDWTGFQADTIFLRVNNDSGANYRYSNIQVANNAVSGANVVAATKAGVGIHARGGATAGVFAAGKIVISGWNAPHSNFLSMNQQSVISDTTAATNWHQSGAASYIGTSPYTRIDLLPDDTGRNFVAGSQYVLYGIL